MAEEDEEQEGKNKLIRLPKQAHGQKRSFGFITSYGSFNNYVDRILSFFAPPPPAWTVFIP